MRNQNNTIGRIATMLLLFAAVLAADAQELTVKSMVASPFDLTAASKPVYDYNNVACGLVKVQLAAQGAEFGGNIIPPVKHEISQYLVYMTAGSKMLHIQCPGYLPIMIDFRDYDIPRIESQQTYVLTLVLPNNGNAPVDDGMRYLIITVNPSNAIVFVDDKLQPVQNGSASVLVPRGTHTYRVEATGYQSESGSVEVADGRKTVDVNLKSAMARLTVNCPTNDAQIYVNEQLKGTAPWNGQLMAGNYQIEARLDGYRSQRQSIALAEQETRTIDIPALTAIVGALNVNYQPVNSEVWMDGKKLGVEPDIFRNIIVGQHSVEVRANGYQSDNKTITIREGETAQLSGELKALASSGSNAITSSSNAIASSSNAITSSSNAITSSSNATMPVPEAIDLGLSVKWASFNLGASKPEEYGYFYKWGETTPADTKGWKTYKYAKGSYKKLTKYCSDARYAYKGFIDNKTKLEPMDDAATVNLGDKWRMPTSDEIDELIKKCKYERTQVNGINGIRVTGPNGKSIFFPASGFLDDVNGKLYGYGIDGDYWAASSDSDGNGCYFCFPYYSNWYLSGNYRSNGYSVRPVLTE